MSSTDDVLDAIDRAVDEYDLSPDAMRWTPDPVPDEDVLLDHRDGTYELTAPVHYAAVGPLGAEPGVGGWVELGIGPHHDYLVVDEWQVSPQLLANVHEAVRPLLAELTAHLVRSAERFEAAVRSAADAFELVGAVTRQTADRIEACHVADLLGVPRELLGLPSTPPPEPHTPRPQRVRPPDRPLPLPHNHAGPPAGRIRGPRTIGRPHTGPRR